MSVFRSGSMFAMLALAACSTTVIKQLPGDAPVEDTPTDPEEEAAADAGAAIEDAGPSTPPAKVTAPQIQSYGGPVLLSPRVVPVFFPNDAYQAQIMSMAQRMGASDYWSKAVGEYGVRGLSVGNPVSLTQSAPTSIDDAAIKTFLAAQLDGTHAAWGSPDERTIYTLFYPTSTRITLEGQESCQTFGGYHSEVQIGSKKVAYAVLPRCTFSGMNQIDTLTMSLSHEWVEAATDPFPFTNPAYAIPDDDHLVYAIFPLSEIGDMCTFNAGANIRPADVGFLVQRVWSNAAAKAGKHPCAPQIPGEVYFNAAPLFTEQVNIDFGGGQRIATSGVRVAVGQSKTVEVQLFSEAATNAFTVSAVDYQAYYYQASPELTFAFDKRTGVNGDKLKMTITRTKTGSQYGGSPFIVTASLGSTKQNFWVGFASN